MSQATIEERFIEKLMQIREGLAPPSEVFADEAEMLLEIDGQRLLFHPLLLHWLLWDRIHGEWYDTGYGPGEALLVVDGGRAVPVPLSGGPPSEKLSTVGDWCLVADAGGSRETMREGDVRQALSEARFPDHARIWSAAGNEWFAPEAFAARPTAAPPVSVDLYLAGPGDGPAPSATMADADRVSAESRCTKCGAPLVPGNRFCGDCGQRVAATDVT